MKGSITPKNLERLVKNQELFQNDPPVTTRATFKLFELEELIGNIRKAVGKVNESDEYTHHYVCITFVRQNVQDEEDVVLYDSRHISSLKKNANKKGFTQLIPIITGCIGTLDGSYEVESFKYLRKGDRIIKGEIIKDKTINDNTIEFVRPGGEGTGLIPPPPPKDDNFL